MKTPVGTPGHMHTTRFFSLFKREKCIKNNDQAMNQFIKCFKYGICNSG